MTQANRVDRVIIRMGIDMLLEHVRRTEIWWRACGDGSTLDSLRQFEGAINTTREKFFAGPSEVDADRLEALFVAEGLRESARHCREGEGALQARLVGAADIIERLCRR